MTTAISPNLRALLDRAGAINLGPAPWRARKRHDAAELCELVDRAERLDLEFLDLATDLRAVVRMRVPVPLGPDRAGSEFANEAVLGVHYPRAAMTSRVAGFTLVRVLEPAGVWHPNVATGPLQAMCLGALPIGIRVSELVFLAFRALSLQEIQADVRDPAGVLNSAAAAFWVANLGRTPLTGATLLSPVEDR